MRTIETVYLPGDKPAVVADHPCEPEFVETHDALWASHANCRGISPELFVDTPELLEAAKAICARCVVLEDCLTTSLSSLGKFKGIRGNTTERERRVMVRGPRPIV